METILKQLKTEFPAIAAMAVFSRERNGFLLSDYNSDLPAPALKILQTGPFQKNIAYLTCEGKHFVLKSCGPLIMISQLKENVTFNKTLLEHRVKLLCDEFLKA